VCEHTDFEQTLKPVDGIVPLLLPNEKQVAIFVPN
jgi:hypothetical protein